jgi:peptidoglycan-associated lipoprotein
MKKIHLSLVLSLCCAVTMLAQPINRATPEANLKAAQEAEASNNPYEALSLYEKVYEDNKEKEIAIKMAKLNFELRDYERAEKSLSKIVARDKNQEYTELQYWLAMSMKHNGKASEAAEMFNRYIAEGTDDALKAKCKLEIEGCELAKKAKQPENLKWANLGKKANSPQTEASPSYSGGELYYASLQSKEVIELNGKEGDWHSKIYTSTPAEKEFSEPTALGTQINREGYHQGNVSVTPDGKTMYFTRIELDNNAMKDSKIFYSKKGADGWGAAYECVGVNGDFTSKHPCEGELFGEKVLFFVANLPGGKGGFDLYYAPKKGDGQFGLPVNLGEVLNTPGEEASPYYRDGKLFFSSNGRPSIGGLDVFESQWNGATWSAPKPLPLGVNSTLDDLFYTQTNDPLVGFVVSNRPGVNNLKSKTCCDDIYGWEYERVKVDLIARTFRKKRKGEKEVQPLTGSVVQLFDVTDKNPATVEEKANQASHEFPFMLQIDKKYMAIATNPGYTSDTVEFNTVGIKKNQTVEKRFVLGKVKKKPREETIVVKENEPIRLDNIYYDYDKWDIRPDAEPDLQFLTDLLIKYPDMKIELSSHTDSRGKDEYNETLSQKRAESAKNWIVAKGINTDRIVPKGYGEKVLLNGCSNGVECSEDDHQLNRRTEFKIIAGPTSITIERTTTKKLGDEEDDTKDPSSGGKQSIRKNPLFFYIRD